jgi:MFS family permease
MKKIVDRFKNRVQNFKINFKKKFKEAKEKPKSKRKSFILGVTTAVAIFGFTLFGPALLAVAEDLPKGNPKPTDIVPVPAPSLPPSNEIINSLSGLASTVCALAITSGSFLVGALCGCIIVAGILHLEKKIVKIK